MNEKAINASPYLSNMELNDALRKMLELGGGDRVRFVILFGSHARGGGPEGQRR